jgi:hypothetical protein
MRALIVAVPADQPDSLSGVSSKTYIEIWKWSLSNFVLC